MAESGGGEGAGGGGLMGGLGTLAGEGVQAAVAIATLAGVGADGVDAHCVAVAVVAVLAALRRALVYVCNKTRGIAVV